MGCFEPPPVFHGPGAFNLNNLITFRFTSLKKHMGGKQFSTDEEVKWGGGQLVDKGG